MLRTFVIGALVLEALLGCKSLHSTFRGRHTSTDAAATGAPSASGDAIEIPPKPSVPSPTVPDEVFKIPEPSQPIPLEGVVNRRAGGGIEVAGAVSGVWDKAVGAVFVVGDITLKTGKTLIVKDGVRVQFEGDYRFYVEGAQLKIIGSAAAPVVFTSADAQRTWQGIRVCPAADCSLDQVLGKLEIRFASFERSRKADPDPNDVTWRRGGVLYIRNTETTLIEDSLFQNNSSSERAGALEIIAENPNTIFRRNTLKANSSDGGGGALQLTNGRDLTVEGNQFLANSTKGEGGAIAFVDSAALLVRGNSFEGNRADAGGGAIACDGHGPTIQIDSDNVFRGNTPNDVVCRDP